MHENTSHGHLQAKAFWTNLSHDGPAPPSMTLAYDQRRLPPKKPSKRIRISTACINCRHKKIKCDGQVPCAHCEKFRSECVYPVATKPANQEYVETLENRLKSVESHLHGLLSRGWGKGPGGNMPMPHDDPNDFAEEPESASPYTPASIPDTPPSKLPSHPDHPTPSSNHPPSHSNNNNNNNNNNNTSQPSRHSIGLSLSRQFSGASITTPQLSGTDTGSDSEEPFATDESMDVLGLLMGNLKIERDGSAQYIPKFLDHQEHSYSDTRIYASTPAGASIFTDLTSLDWESADQPASYTLPSSLLTPKAIGSLMDIYFNSVHTFLPVIHKNSFLTLCQEGEYRVPPFLLLSICAVAARHATDIELQEIPELANLKNHHTLFDHARALLDTFMDVPRLSTVQGLLLLAYYQTKEKRPGHFFRVRMYINMATRMALDMGLHRALRKSIKDMDASMAGASAQLTREKRAVVHQEQRLAWLGCFFLDGLTSSLMGQDYSVVNAALDMPKLIREAGLMMDTVQGATLIFWFHHLELVQLYRRICVFYRSIPNERTLARAIVGSDMHSIETGLEDWMLNLPAHLVYVESTALPSYYTLYLHRFYFSHKLLLYRPLISSKTHRGDLKDTMSPMAKCSQAAQKMTQIGEIIFQNYSWPWPGCGLFAYHMLQAAEVHVFLMVTQSTMDAQSLYYRTMDLIKGYVSLAKLPGLEKDVLAMEEMVSNFLLTPQDPVTHSNTFSNQGPQHQQFVATPASDYSHTSVMSPSSPVESVSRMAQTNGNDSHMFSPMQANTYSSFRQTQGASNMGATSTAAYMNTPMHDAESFSMGFEVPSSSAAPSNNNNNNNNNSNNNNNNGGGIPTPSSSMYEPSNQLPFYGAATSAAAMSMFESHQQGLSYNLSGQPGSQSFLQPALAPVGDLLGLGNNNNGTNHGNGMNNRMPFGPNSGASAALPPMTLPSYDSDTKKRSAVPPPKPPKRILPQSTGSSSSSAVSQSMKPPVPKKPTRLTEIAPRWIAPRPDTTVVPPIPLIPSSSGPDMYYSGTGRANDMPPPAYSGPAPNLGAPNGRPIRVLQPQTTLYGQGALVNTLGVEQQVHPVTIEADEPAERVYYSAENALQYLHMNPHLYDQIPPEHRRQVL